jgi:hypothetical protein
VAAAQAILAVVVIASMVRESAWIGMISLLAISNSVHRNGDIYVGDSNININSRRVKSNANTYLHQQQQQ